MGSYAVSEYFVNKIYPLLKNSAEKGLHRGASLIKYYTKKEAQKNVQKVVYDAYVPKVYKRRKNNKGLIDINNFKFTNEKFSTENMMNNVIQVSFFATFDNITLTNGFMTEKTSGDRAKRYLAPIIENGNSQINAPYAKPRRFMEKTKNYINGTDGENNGRIYKTLTSSIKSQLDLDMNFR